MKFLGKVDMIAGKFYYSLLVIVLAGCAVPVEPLQRAELRDQGKADLEQIFPEEDRVTGLLTLDGALRRTLAMNLDRKLARLEEAYALGQRHVDQWDMLPDLSANAGYSYRSEYYATTSSGLDGQPFDSEPNYSSQKNSFTPDLTVTWNVLDFAVGYFNAKQSADRALIAAERRRRAEMNFVRDTNTAYWRALAAQRLAKPVDEAIGEAERALRNAGKSVEFGLQDPLTELRMRKTILETLRQLEGLRQELAIADIQLNHLIRARPDEEIILADEVMEPPNLEMGMDEMLESAFINSPDIREQIYRVRVAMDETKKAALDFFPKIIPSFGVNYDLNRFLDENTWVNFGLDTSLNLFRLASVPFRVERAEEAVEVEELRQLAVRMAVMAQTYIARNQFNSARQQYERSRQLFDVEAQIVRETDRRGEIDFQSEVDRVVVHTAAIMAELRMHHAYARVMAEHAALMATIGDNSLADEMLAEEWMKKAAEAAEEGEEPEEVIDNPTFSPGRRDGI